MSGALNKILHVEDEADIREVTKMALEAVGGLTVRSCGDSEEALLVTPEFEPDLFLLDVMMPGRDGPETWRALQDLPGFEDTPAIFMTAKVMGTEVDRFKELCALGVIAKPFDPMTLSDQIRSLWKEKKSEHPASAVPG